MSLKSRTFGPTTTFFLIYTPIEGLDFRLIHTYQILDRSV